jgi:hypothetical protein
MSAIMAESVERMRCGDERSLFAITAKPIRIQWDPSLPVFAKEEFLKAVGDEYGWLGGFDASGTLRCILPYTIVHKAGLRMVRFRVETIPCGELDAREEKAFLNDVVRYFREIRADIIIPGSNNAIFRTCPDGAHKAPYGSYVIDLQQSEEALWRNIARITRQNIGTAQRDGVSIREGMEFLEPAYDLIIETFRRSRIPFMNRISFEQGKLLVAEHKGVAHSYCLFGFSQPRAYAIFAGNINGQHQGASKLLYWESIRVFRNLGVEQFDFYGARINPPKDSKQEGINLMKKRFGATLTEGYMWKYAIRPLRASLYSVSVRLLRGGDIVDRERIRLRDYSSN